MTSVLTALPSTSLAIAKWSWLCGLGLEDFRPDSIAIYTSLQLAVLDEFSDITYTIRGKALTAEKMATEMRK